MVTRIHEPVAPTITGWPMIPAEGRLGPVMMIRYRCAEKIKLAGWILSTVRANQRERGRERNPELISPAEAGSMSSGRTTIGRSVGRLLPPESRLIAWPFGSGFLRHQR